MSLGKLKKAELQALAKSHDLSYDPDWTKDELIENLEAEGIETESVDNEVSTDIHSDGKRRTKAKRQRQLLARTNHEPGEATLMRGKKFRQQQLLARTDRTK